ncbi:MAG: hypothetical protein AAFY26_00685 [Cyanobacteria bacterium J06638_22]
MDTPLSILTSSTLKTLSNSWSTFKLCDEVGRRIALQIWAVLSSEAAQKRYEILWKLTTEILEIVYLGVICCVVYTLKQVDRIVQDSLEKSVSIPAAAKLQTPSKGASAKTAAVSSAKISTAKKTTAKKATTKTPTTKRSTAKKTTAKKAPAKRSTMRTGKKPIKTSLPS